MIIAVFLNVSSRGEPNALSITQKPYGQIDGQDVHLFTLQNQNAMQVEITNYGGIIVSLSVPDKNGTVADITLGYDSLKGYVTDSSYLGALIGRHANRLEDAEFELAGVTYDLAKNDGANHLHGGFVGFHKVIWSAKILEDNSLELTYFSRDGEENYPGNLDVKVIYTLTADNALEIHYHAISDKDTVVNLTNHAYFNLAEHNAGDISQHQLRINAKHFTAVNDQGLPTGEIHAVENTPMDFTTLNSIASGLDSDHPQIVCGQGYDHNWILDTKGWITNKAAELYEVTTGRVLEVYTTKPGLQFYSGNFLTGTEVGKSNSFYPKRSALCLETQYFPNAMKHKHFPSPVLQAGQEYRHTTIYAFSIR